MTFSSRHQRLEPDVSLYTENPRLYLEVQQLRPDYTAAINATVELAVDELKGKACPSTADFCCGTGSNTGRVAEELGELHSALLIDINAEFLRAASSSIANVRNIQVRCSDVLKVRFGQPVDLVLSVFAYHHVPDNDKLRYLEQAIACSKRPGALLLTEIYSPRPDTTCEY